MVGKSEIELILKKENLSPEDHLVLENYEPNDGSNKLLSLIHI